MPTLPRQGAINAHLLSHVQVGDELDVWWPLDNVYYPGVVGAVEADGRHRIDYTDGDVELVFLTKERWKFRGKSADRVMRALISPVRHPTLQSITTTQQSQPPQQQPQQPPPPQQQQDIAPQTTQQKPQEGDHDGDGNGDHGPQAPQKDPAGDPHMEQAEMRAPQESLAPHPRAADNPAENGQAPIAGDTPPSPASKTRWRKAKGRGRGAIVK
eukprot:GFKZ01000335.1.p1 GENE.GFKZ01000335.1~~GFKZ01000335.1.p1  ORF type:complete len:241 (+),score=29.92 GFKZ01000335.1:86-724(+)